ncbi:hypothetical protein B0H19DRAFT_1365470 [Mycena capillaripes]|nr:hypothetical protein B0H19DRAFT_1365470 [Mycena capillaripes]
MKKAQAPGDDLAKSESNRVPSDSIVSDPESRSFLDVPPELCAIVARFASRQSLASLCSVSHHFYSIFSALLYANTVEPPLKSAQSLRLMKTLSDARTLNWKPHPAILIRQLALTHSDDNHLNYFKSQAGAPADLLRNTYRLIPAAQRSRGSALRSLHWNLMAGLDELGGILGASGYFPNLRELMVSCNGTTNFSFIQIPGLQVLGLDLSLPSSKSDIGDINDEICYKLSEAIQMLPNTSPRLHTLQLKFKIPFYLYTFPYLGRDHLLAAINTVHLPVLAALILSVDFFPDEDDVNESLLPGMDFSPFLSAHPNLVDLTLDARGTKLTQDVAFLPRLRSFKGSFEDSAVICAPQRQLDELVLRFVHRAHFEPPLFYTQPLPSHSSLTKLDVLAVDSVGSVVKMTNELSPTSLAHLVSSFPNLTHLNICINGRMNRYRKSLIRLTKLQSLRMQEYRKISALKVWPVMSIFPPADYTKDFPGFLSHLPQLACIEICVLGDSTEWDEDSDPCPCCDSRDCGSPGLDFELIFSPPEMRVDYRFSVIRTAIKTLVVLDDARVSDKR